MADLRIKFGALINKQPFPGCWLWMGGVREKRKREKLWTIQCRR